MAKTCDTFSLPFDCRSDVVRRVLASLQGHTPFGVKVEDYAGTAWLAYKKAYGELGSASDPGNPGEIEAQIFTRVRRSVISEIRRQLPLSTKTQQRHRVVVECRRRLAGETGEEPTLAQIAEASGLSENAARRALAAGGFACPDQIDNHFDIRDEGPDAAETADVLDRATILRSALQTLPWQQRRVIVGLFYDHETPADLAAELKVTVNRVYQIRDAGLQKLRVKQGVSELDPGT